MAVPSSTVQLHENIYRLPWTNAIGAENSATLH